MLSERIQNRLSSTLNKSKLDFKNLKKLECIRVLKNIKSVLLKSTDSEFYYDLFTNTKNNDLIIFKSLLMEIHKTKRHIEVADDFNITELFSTINDLEKNIESIIVNFQNDWAYSAVLNQAMLKVYKSLVIFKQCNSDLFFLFTIGQIFKQQDVDVIKIHDTIVGILSVDIRYLKNNIEGKLVTLIHQENLIKDVKDAMQLEVIKNAVNISNLTTDSSYTCAAYNILFDIFINKYYDYTNEEKLEAFIEMCCSFGNFMTFVEFVSRYRNDLTLFMEIDENNICGQTYYDFYNSLTFVDENHRVYSVNYPKEVVEDSNLN